MNNKLSTALKILGAAASVLAASGLLLVLAMGNSSPKAEIKPAGNMSMLNRFDSALTGHVNDAMTGMTDMKKVFWLNDDVTVAPEPDQTKYGSTSDPSSLGWLMEEAQTLLQGQETVFNTEIQIAPGTQVLYYLDQTIFAVTWKQGINGGMYTFSEVKIAHPSQLRRYFTGDQYGSYIRQQTSEMASIVNAVVASSGDFYAHRRHGVIVYDGVVERVNSYLVDTCYIDDNGDMLFSRAGELPDVASAQAFVDEHNIRFSIAFGPVLVEDGVMDLPGYYYLGEISDEYPRAALGQKGDLHYVVMTLNSERGYSRTGTLYRFANVVDSMGFEQAYTLDGGQTAVIVMNDRLINAVLFGVQRDISDIFYFATAMPDGG